MDQLGNKLEKGDRVAVSFQPGMLDALILEVINDPAKTSVGVVFAITIPVAGDNKPIPGVVKVHQQPVKTGAVT